MFDQWEVLWPNLMTPQAAALFVLILLAVVGLAVLVAKRFRPVHLLQSLRNRLLLAFIGVAVVSVGMMILALALRIQATLEAQTGRASLIQTELSADRLAEQIGNQISQLEEVSLNYSIAYQVAQAQKPLDEMSPEERELYFYEQSATFADPDEAFFRRSLSFNPVSVVLSRDFEEMPLYSQLLVTDVYGGLAGVIGEEPEEFYFGDEVWWHEARNSDQEDALFLSEPYLADDGQTVLLDIVMPLINIQAGPSSDETSTIQGVLRGKLQLSDFALFTESEGLGENIELALLNDISGMWLFSSKYPQKVGTMVPQGVQDNIAQNPLNWGIDPDETGQRVIHSHSVLQSSPEQPYLDDLGLTIVFQQPASVDVSNMLNFVSPVAIGAGFALLVAGIVGFLIARQISRPIISLSNTAVAMADGQLDQTARESGVAELKTLAVSFNRMTEQLRQILQELEQQVVARTERLEIVATLGERLSSILNVDDLLDEVVDQIQKSFGYYHAHIYLLDSEEQNLVVAAGTGSAGAEMKAEGHSIPLHTVTSLVARSARSGDIVRVDNVRETPDWLPNPLLPDTYSEMAVPITLEEKVVGVLDVQQDRIAGLDQGDAALLRSLANQVAVAINNARLFEQVETALTEAREAQRRYIEQAWDARAVAGRSAGRVQFSLGESTTLSEVVLAKARQQASTQTQPAVITVEHNDSVPNEKPAESEETALTINSADQHHVLVAPITFADTVIGNLQLHEVDPNRQWTEGELTMINAVIDQVAQTAENLRLLNETQERASREQLISQVSDKLRRAPDMESLMKVATAEIARVLNPARTFIRFDTKTKDRTDDNSELPLSGNGKSDGEMSQVEDNAATVGEHLEE